MPWEQSAPMDQKTQFVSEYLRDTISFTELCDRYGISRKTGYKWIDRYQAEGPAGLADRSRRPHSSPDETPEPLRNRPAFIPFCVDRPEPDLPICKVDVILFPGEREEFIPSQPGIGGDNEDRPQVSAISRTLFTSHQSGT
jgi:transposase-like protein